MEFGGDFLKHFADGGAFFSLSLSLLSLSLVTLCAVDATLKSSYNAQVLSPSLSPHPFTCVCEREKRESGCECYSVCVCVCVCEYCGEVLCMCVCV